MSDANLKELVVRIRQELEEIRRVMERIDRIWESARRSNDDYYLDAAALNLHGFYLGFERIFVRVAETIDEKTGQPNAGVVCGTGARPAAFSCVFGKRRARTKIVLASVS